MRKIDLGPEGLERYRQRLVKEIGQYVREYWKQNVDGMPISTVTRRFNTCMAKAELSITQVLDILSGRKVLSSVIMKNGKTYVLPWEQWEDVSEERRALLRMSWDAIKQGRRRVIPKTSYGELGPIKFVQGVPMSAFEPKDLDDSIASAPQPVVAKPEAF